MKEKIIEFSHIERHNKHKTDVNFKLIELFGGEEVQIFDTICTVFFFYLVI
jgi:hypothetical protein